MYKGFDDLTIVTGFTMCLLLAQIALYHSLAIYTEVTFVNVTLVEAGPSGADHV